MFEVLMEENNLLKITGFQNASLCSLVQRYQHPSQTLCLRFPAYLSKSTTSKVEDLNDVNTPSFRVKILYHHTSDYQALRATRIWMFAYGCKWNLYNT